MLTLDYDGHYDLFAPDRLKRGAWLHRSGFFEFLLKHATKNDDGTVHFPKLCVIFEVDVHAETLWELRFDASRVRPESALWVHSDCIRRYYR